MQKYPKELCEEMYLDYVNNFLTVARFAEYYEIREQTARYIIAAGRVENHLTKGI